MTQSISLPLQQREIKNRPVSFVRNPSVSAEEAEIILLIIKVEKERRKANAN